MSPRRERNKNALCLEDEFNLPLGERDCKNKTGRQEGEAHHTRLKTKPPL
jgi:hypothetical protein